MSRVELVPAEAEHIASIAERMRDWDATECKAFCKSPESALKLSLVASVDCFTAFVDGRPEAMLGLVPKNILEGEGQPWMLGTEAIYDNPRATLVLSRCMVAMWSDSTPHLSGLVAAGNERAIRYLRRLGFDVGKERQVVGGTEFVMFTREPR